MKRVTAKEEPTAEELVRMDKEFIWHPFTQMADWLKDEPLIVAAGEGRYLIDVHGKRYLDGVSSLWVTVHGHRQPDIDRAIIEQLSRIGHSTFLGLSNVPAVKLAKELAGLCPGELRKVFYSDNGSTAVEVALKMSFQYWNQRHDPKPEKKRFMTFKNAYHGDSIGSVSVGGIDLFHKTYRPMLFDSIKVNSPYCYRCHLRREYPGCGMACLGEVEETLERCHGEIAALVMEPLVQAAAGILVFPRGYSKKVSEFAAKHGVLVIADEVATGFGRTGRMFACQNEGITPDSMTVAKGITGGYLPLAATLTTREVFDAFCGPYEADRTFFHGHTYTANPLACAAALANLEVMRRDDTLGLLQGKIAYLSDQLVPFRRLRHVGDVRQLGFMVGIELVKDCETKEEFPRAAKTGIRVTKEARRRGLIIRPLGDVVVLMPPLGISMSELGELLDTTYESIKAVTEAE
ncbi:MAG: adenosylmethionine--8-amino-7-oxononanoate transaminase [Dehalococcoidia bacterium]|nr:adenosylmethionine--8-amino-7-oxononanoate transaminase [Dehalococcoidia bacterium]